MVWAAPAMGHYHHGMAAMLSPSLRDSLGIRDMADSAPEARGILLKATQPGAWGPWEHVTQVLLQSSLPLNASLFPVVRSLGPPVRTVAAELMLTKHRGHM